ncbi:MAG: M3 family oligoendopeptidase [Rectinemataceae bacterium]
MAGSEDAVRGDLPRRDAEVPRWDLSPIYPSLASPEFAAAKARIAELTVELIAHLPLAPAPIGAAKAEGLGDWLAKALELENATGSLYETLSAYAYASFSTATGDASTLVQLNAIEELGLPLRRAEVLFRNALAARRAEVEALIDLRETRDPRVAGFAFHIREELFWQSRQMAPELEDLAADLSRSGGDAWARLQETLTSLASTVWNAETGERKTLVDLRNLAYDRDRAIREKAHRLERELCRSMKVPAAAALNGVKGFTVTLNARRGWAGALDKSIEQARITRETLDSLIGSLEESLPSWRRYLGAKARMLGLDKCAFFDLFAPVSGPGETYSFSRARDFIVEKFSSFDPEMGDFASRAFADCWIDAEPREGKVGGGYCIDFPEAKACRVLCNFDGSFNSVNTIAHELGHAWHAERVRGLPYVYTQYPMTLAETASIFSETLVFEGALKAASGSGQPAERRAALLELHLQDACQVIVDILSRFYFERSVFERRAKAELSPEELCELMLDAQKKSYGDGLDPERLHPYMWLVKGHYYSQDLAFYNFPYAFGQLFGAGLYARYEAEGRAFVKVYRGILEDTGKASAVTVTAKAGFDIEKPEFWREGLAIFARQVEEFEKTLTAPSAS